MKNKVISEKAKPKQVVMKIANLALSQEDSAISDLGKLLNFNFNFYGEHNLAITHLASRALLQKGRLGVQMLRDRCNRNIH